mgnify:CR=1 FL=1
MKTAKEFLDQVSNVRREAREQILGLETALASGMMDEDAQRRARAAIRRIKAFDNTGGRLVNLVRGGRWR